MPLPAGAIHPTMQTAALPTFPNGTLHAGQFTLIFRIRHKASGDLLKEHDLILMPQQFSQETESRTSLYYTQQGVVADTPAETGVGATIFTISGHTGFRGILDNRMLETDPADIGPASVVSQIGAQIASTVQSVVSIFGGRGLPPTTSLIDGAAAVKDLQDAILAYFYPQGQLETRVVTQTQDLQLEFLNLSAPTSAEDQAGRVGWIVHPHRNLVSLRQDATRPFLYFYQLQFAAIGSLVNPILDPFEDEYTDPRTGLQETLADMTKVVTDVTNGINTIEDAFTHFTITQVTGPIGTFINACGQLGDAVGNFMTGIAHKMSFPLYAQRTFLHALDAPRHSVSTLKQAAHDLAQFLVDAADPRSLGTLFAGTTTTADVNDALTLRLNQEAPVTVHLGSQASGPAIAATLQTAVQAQAPQYGANASAYRAFTATYDPATGAYTLRSGTKLSDAGQVQVVVGADPLLTPTDASVQLGLGVANGGQEYPGSAYANPALALLRGVERACTHLLAFPDYFADQLDAQDAALTAFLPPHATRVQIRGDQRLTQTRITPSDSLQGIAKRVGVDWQSLALVNQLQYPFILEAPTTLTRGRVHAGDLWGLTDVQASWPVNAWQGQRVDIVYGTGAGQSRRILRNTATQLAIETAWEVVPTDTSDYAIRSADNPILHTGMVTSATPSTLTDSALALVPGSQRGLTVLVASGPSFGERARLSGNTEQTLTLEEPWIVTPGPGTTYLLFWTDPSKHLHQRLVGEWLSVPQPSAQTPLPLRTRLQDVSAITGRKVSTEEQLFGRDLLLQDGSLVWDPSAGDCQTIAELPNLRQAVINLINLPIGELEYNPSLGSYVQEELGLVSTLPVQVQVLHSVDRTIRQDARIARLEGAALFSQGGITTITFGAQAVNGASVTRVTIR